MKKTIAFAAFAFVALTAGAQQNYKVQTACHPDDVKHYDTEKLRERFMMEKVMSPDSINLTYTLYDRLIYGGAMPVTKPPKQLQKQLKLNPLKNKNYPILKPWVG